MTGQSILQHVAEFSSFVTQEVTSSMETELEAFLYTVISSLYVPNVRLLARLLIAHAG